MAHVVRRGVGGSLLRVGSVDGRNVRRAVDSRAQVERKRSASATGAAVMLGTANFVFLIKFF